MHRSAIYSDVSSIAGASINESRLYYTGPVSKLTALSVIISLSLPAIASLVTDMINETINIFFIGRLSNPELLSAIGIAISFMNVFFFSVLYGLASSLETLCSQAYGRHDNILCGLFLNKARVIFTICLLPFLIVIFYTEPILNFVGIDPLATAHTGSFVRLQIPFLFVYIQFDITKRFLSAQNKFIIPTTVTIVTTVCHFIWDYIFIFYFGFGLNGVAIANGITWTLDFVFITGYIQFSGCCHDSWFFPNLQSFTNWIEVLRLAIPGAVTLISEYLALELLSFEAGHLGIICLAANVSAQTLVSLIFMIPSGIALTACVLVAMSIGASNIQNAILYAKMSIIYQISLSGILLTAIVIFRKYISFIFTNDEQVINILSKVIPLICIYEFCDGIQGVASGILRGQGNLRLTALGNLTAYYLILQPLALLFAFVLKLNIMGLWIGGILGNLCLVIFYLLFLYKLNWESLLLHEKNISDDIPVSFLNESIDYYTKLNLSL